MESKGKVLMVEKMIKNGISTGKRGRCSTPSPTWRFGLDYGKFSNNVSARKLGSSLWEMQPQLCFGVERNEAVSSSQGEEEGVRGNSEKMSCDFECSNGVKASSELLKLVSRIVKLEKRQALNKSLVKRLRRELRQSEAQIEQLVQPKEMDLCEKTSEKLHAEEIREMQFLLSNALVDIEKERSTRIVLEGLCDEFARGILNYDEKLKLFKKKPSSITSASFEDEIGHVRFIIHISEAWLDARTQMDESDKQCAFDKLYSEIESCIQAKHKQAECARSDTLVHSFESFNLNEHPMSGPWMHSHEDGSVNFKKKTRSGIPSSSHLHESDGAGAGMQGQGVAAEVENESCTKWTQRPHTLRDMLIEARLDDQRVRKRD